MRQTLMLTAALLVLLLLLRVQFDVAQTATRASTAVEEDVSARVADVLCFGCGHTRIIDIVPLAIHEVANVRCAATHQQVD